MKETVDKFFQTTLLNGAVSIFSIFCFVGFTAQALCAADTLIGTETVVAFGDSITAGKGAAPYSVHLQSLVGADATVVNQGVGGEQTVSGLVRIDSVLDVYNPRYILILEGANDAFGGVSPETVAFDLGGMIDKAKAHGSTPILSTITPNHKNDGLGAGIPNNYNPPIVSLAASKGVLLVDSYSNVIADWASLTLDGVHPNEAGAIRLAEGFNAALPYGGGGGGDGGDSGGGGGCFIATAAFGTQLEPQVVLLKQFRDQYLLTNYPGQLFVRLYYEYSPPIAQYISNNENLKRVVRISLAPLIGFSYLAVNLPLILGLFVAAFVVFCFILLYLTRRRRLCICNL